MAPLRKGQLEAPASPPSRNAIAANSNGGIPPEAVVSRAKKDQVRMAKKPIPVAVFDCKDLPFAVDSEID